MLIYSTLNLTEMTSLSINLGHSYFIGTDLTEMLKWNAGIIHYVLFWNGNNGLQYTYFLNSGPQSASVNKWFLNIIYQMLQILQIVNPRHEDWASIQLLTLSVLTFLFINENKIKVRKWLKYMKEFLLRFDLVNGK